MLRKAYAGFAIFVGISMLGLWSMLLLTGQVPELATTPLSIGFHLAAELINALTLIVGGAALYLKHPLGVKIYFVAVGMLIYTVINSSGYYAQSGDWAFVFMFAVILILSLVCLVGLWGRQG